MLKIIVTIKTHSIEKLAVEEFKRNAYSNYKKNMQKTIINSFSNNISHTL